MMGRLTGALLLVAVLATAGLHHAVGQAPDASVKEFYDGVLDIVAITGSSKASDADSIYSLKLSNGQRRQLHFTDNIPTQLLTGMKIRAWVDHSQEHTPRRREVFVHKVDILQLPSGSKDYTTVGNSGQPYTFRSITFLLTICNVAPSVTPEYIQGMWFKDPESSNITMQGYFESCSYSKVAFTNSTNLVVSVPVPCSGTSRTGWRFSSSQCRINEVYGWAEYAEEYAAKNLGVDMTLFQNRIVILPKNACTWGGLGTVGCTKSCYAWIKGDQAKILDTFMHELGHNMGLQHSSTPTSEYADTSSPMGSCCDNPRCYNGPNSWQLGWAMPVANGVLNSKTLQAGKWVDFTLPALTQGPASLVQLTPDWTVQQAANGRPDGVPVFYLSYRASESYDSGLNGKYTGRVSIHIYNGSTGFFSNGFLSQLQQVVDEGVTWSELNTKFRVVVKSAAAQSANVSVCRYTAEQETRATCDDGLDNDCSGLWDADDANCQKTAALSPCNNNGKCEPDNKETAANCPTDCPAVCGDGYCDSGRGESAATCSKDCPSKCGDKFCDSARGETAANCAEDCPLVVCGDGQCSAGFETKASCARDCCPAPVCGDGFCDAFGGESCVTCPADCMGVRIGNKPYCCGSPIGLYGCKDSRCNNSKVSCRLTCEASTPARKLLR